MKIYNKLVVTALTAFAIVGSAVPLHAAESTVSEVKPAQRGDGYVLVNPANPKTKHLPDGRTFMPTGEISPETVVVVTDPDGSLPGAMTQTELTTMVAEKRAAKALGLAPDESVHAVGDQSATSGGDGFSISDYANRRTYSVSYNWGTFPGGSVIGVSDSARLNYKFNVTAGTVQWAQGEGLGYYRGYNGSQFGLWSKYYSMGNAKSGAPGGASIPWGNVASNTSFRAKSLNSIIAGGTWEY